MLISLTPNVLFKKKMLLCVEFCLYFNNPHPKNKIRRSEMANTFLAANEPGLAFVCFFGVAVVFIGLVILIGLVYLMNYLCDKFIKL